MHVHFDLTLPFPASIFVLTLSGIQPLSLHSGTVLLPDKNLLALLGTNGLTAAERYWIPFLDDPSCTLNPVHCAMEGHLRRFPTEGEFRDEWALATKKLRQHLPRASLVAEWEQSYPIARDLTFRIEAEGKFLVAVAPLLAHQVAQRNLRSVEASIFEQAKLHKLQGGGLITIAALACLYEQGTKNVPPPARGVLKPGLGYSEAEAHNAILDLKALEFLLVAGSFGLPPIGFLTRDKSLGRLWRNLQARPQAAIQGKARAFFQLSEKLFPRIDDNGVKRIRAALEAIDSPSLGTAVTL